MTRTGVVIVLVLIAAAVLSGWLERTTPVKPPGTTREFQQVDYFLGDFHIQQYDTTGRLEYTVNGRRLEHHPEDDSATIKIPRLLLRPEDPAARWQIDAKRAHARSTAFDEIVFQGGVRLRRDSDDITLRTDRLRVKPRAQTLASDTPVVLTRPGARIVAKRMDADLKRSRLTLDHVRGRYEP